MCSNFVPEFFGRLMTLDTGYSVLFGSQKRKCHMVRCACGTEKQVLREHLVSGATQSCGCRQKEIAARCRTTHGHNTARKKTPEYTAYTHMLTRCYNPNTKRYLDYGGRGIGVFPDWLGPGGFERWLAHIGPRPSKKHSQDRFPNPDGNYEPGNVRWATDEEQANNKRNNRWITHENQTRNVAQWSDVTGIHSATISSRLEAGWSVEETLTTPVKQRKSKYLDNRSS